MADGLTTSGCLYIVAENTITPFVYIIFGSEHHFSTATSSTSVWWWMAFHYVLSVIIITRHLGMGGKFAEENDKLLGDISRGREEAGGRKGPVLKLNQSPGARGFD